MIRIIGVGDNTVDTYTHLREKFPGGNSVNVAVLAHRYGAEAAYLGTVGNDDAGRLILGSLEKEGLDISKCVILDGVPTAFSTVTVIDGDRIFGESDSGASDRTKLTAQDFVYIQTFDVIHTSVYSNIESQLPELKKVSKVLSFDLSQRSDDPYLQKVVPYSDIVFLSLSGINDDDCEKLMSKIISLGAKLLVMTKGKEGSWVFDGEKLYHQGILPVETVDSLGAGDAFAARFLVEYLGGKPIAESMLLAAESAAQNCTHFGAYGYGVKF